MGGSQKPELSPGDLCSAPCELFSGGCCNTPGFHLGGVSVLTRVPVPFCEDPMSSRCREKDERRLFKNSYQNDISGPLLT